MKEENTNTISSGMSILVGRPGTGKTVLLNRLRADAPGADQDAKNCEKFAEIPDEGKRASVVMGQSESDDGELNGPTIPAHVRVVRMIQRNKLRYNDEDLNKFVLAAIVSDVDYDYFCCPDDDHWWSNGRDNQEWFGDAFRLFRDAEEIQKAADGELQFLQNTTRLNVYSLELLDGAINFNFEYSMIAESETESEYES